MREPKKENYGLHRASMKTIDQRRAAATKTTHLACTPFSHCLGSVLETGCPQASCMNHWAHTLQIPASCQFFSSPEGKESKGWNACVHVVRLALSEIHQIYCTHADPDHLRVKQLSHMVMLCFPRC